MSRYGRIVAVLALAVALPAIVLLALDRASAQIALEPDDAQRVAHGKRVYATYCASCHGPSLEGEPDWRQRRADGKLPAPPHDETGHTWHHPDQQLFAITKLGTEALVGGTYRSDMIGFGDVLSDEDIVAVLSFIKSTWPDDVRRQHDEINARATGG